jgi:hypothetical protein
MAGQAIVAAPIAQNLPVAHHRAEPAVERAAIDLIGQIERFRDLSEIGRRAQILKQIEDDLPAGDGPLVFAGLAFSLRIGVSTFLLLRNEIS